MKYTITGLFIGLLVVSCGETKRENYTTLDEEGNITISGESIKILEEIQGDYDHCKATETEERECNHFTSEAISRFYQIEDFKREMGYVSFREIKDIVTR